MELGEPPTSIFGLQDIRELNLFLLLCGSTLGRGGGLDAGGILALATSRLGSSFHWSRWTGSSWNRLNTRGSQ